MSSPYMQHARRQYPDHRRLDASGLQSPEIRAFVLETFLSELPSQVGTASGHFGPLVQAAIAERFALPWEEGVVHTLGTSMANHLAMAALIEQPGDQVLIEHPTYSLLTETAGTLFAAVHSFEREEDYRIDPDRIRAAIAQNALTRLRLIVLTNLHNPSSALLDRETLQAVGEIAREHGARVLVDEVYLESLFEQPEPPAATLGPTFISTGSLTKAYGLSMVRCGWILAEPALAERIRQMRDLFYVLSPDISDQMSLTALRHLPEIRALAAPVLQANLQVLNDFLSSRPDLDVPSQPHGTVSFPRVRTADVPTLCDLLHSEYATRVTDGRFFGAPNHIRIGIGESTDTVREGLDCLGHALDRLSA